MKKNWLIGILVLAMAGIGWGANTTYYVDPVGGTDATTDGRDGSSFASAKAWKTIQFAVDNNASSSGETVTINVVAGATLTDSLVQFDGTPNVHQGRNFVIQSSDSASRYVATGTAGVTFFYIASGVTEGSLTVKDLAINNGDILYVFNIQTTGAMDCALNNCSVALTRAASRIYYTTTDAADYRDLTITNSAVTSVGAAIYYPAGLVTVTGSQITSTAAQGIISNSSPCDGIAITGSTITANVASTSGKGILLTSGNAVPFVTIYSSTITAYTSAIDCASIADTTLTIDTNSALSSGGVCIVPPQGLVTITDSTITSTASNCIPFTGNSAGLKLSGSTITAAGAGIYTTSGKTISYVVASNSTISAVNIPLQVVNGCKTVLIDKCTLTSSGTIGCDFGNATTGTTSIENLVVKESKITGKTVQSGGATGLSIGFNLTSFTVLGNYIAGYTHALFCRSGNGAIENNIIYCTGTTGAVLYADNIVFRSNTVYTASGTALTVGAGATFPEDTLASRYLKIYNNVLVSGDGLAYNDYDDSAGINNGTGRGADDSMGDYVDYNCYYSVSGDYRVKIGMLDHQESCNTRAEIIDAWKTATHAGTYWNIPFGDTNDQHSLTINPLLDSNYRAKNAQLKGAGSPILVDSDGTVLLSNDIGATKFSGASSSGLSGESSLLN
jgi:hypothetical protein